MSYLKIAASQSNLHYQFLENREDRKRSACVVFLHGLVMDNLSSWFFTLANPVAQHYDALVYDMRGHGFSDRPRTGYSIEDHREDLKALLDHVAEDRPVILVGNSFGGLLALNFALAYPERLQGLVLVDAQLNDPAWKEQMLASFSLEGTDRDQMISANFQNWLGRSSTRKSSRLAKNAEDLIYQTSLIEDLRRATMMRDEDLQSIQVPTRAIYGGESDILTTALKLSAELPHCDLKIVPGASHSVLWEQTDLVKEWIISSIDALQELSPAAVTLPFRKVPEYERELR